MSLRWAHMQSFRKCCVPVHVVSFYSGMPAETATAICCMTMGGVLERFPKLKVCFAHGGKYRRYVFGLNRTLFNLHILIIIMIIIIIGIPD